MFLMQENHSFDNYFGTFPGADGFPEGTCVPGRSGQTRGLCQALPVGRSSDYGPGSHDGDVQGPVSRWCNDGFISAFAESGDPTNQAMGYYTDEDLPYYWNIAKEYVLFDKFFTSAGGGSVWNHLYWVAAVPGNPKGDSIPAEGFSKIPTIFDRLEEKGVSWKFYVQNYDPSITYGPIAPRTMRTGVPR